METSRDVPYPTMPRLESPQATDAADLLACTSATPGTPPDLRAAAGPVRSAARSPLSADKLLHSLTTSVGFRLKAFAIAAGFCLAQGAGAAEVAPYVAAWGPGTLLNSKQTAGLDSARLAFGVTRGNCAFDQYLLDKLPDARSYAAAGGKLTISLGGADGIYAEVSCTDDQLFALVEKLMVDSGTRRIDWDVEGAQLANVDATARRNRVLLRLQAKYPDFYTSLTLPAWLRGLEGGLDVVRSAVAAGVRIDMVNAMAMSFGLTNVQTMVSPATMGQAVIDAARSTVAQLATVYPNKTQAQLYGMMGLTPMIGINDDSSTFTLADAKTVADFAAANGVGLLAYWAFHRDQNQAGAGTYPITTYSGVAQSNYQFLNTFKTAATAAVAAPAPAPAAASNPAPTPAPAPAPAPAPTTASSSPSAPAPWVCTYTVWVQGRNYLQGSIVTYKGNLYAANAPNPGYEPGVSPVWSRYMCNNPVLVGASTPAPAPAPTPAPATKCTATVWVDGRYYPAGSIVSYKGSFYSAKFANPGYNPTISTYFWAKQAC